MRFNNGLTGILSAVMDFEQGTGTPVVSLGSED